MVSGASKLAYWSSHYFVDFLNHYAIAYFAKRSILYLRISAPKVEAVLMAFSLTNPIFIYALSFLFDTDSKASVIVRILYFAFGGVAPIAVIVLAVVNKETVVIGNMLAQYFYFWPVYNLNEGYLSIRHRKMIATRAELDHNLDPLSWQVAGENIFNMHCCLAFCTFFIIVVELGFYQFFVKPVFNMVSLYYGHYYGTLRPKKRKKLYEIRRDSKRMDLEASDDEEDRRNTLAARKFLRINDVDPLREEQRVISDVLNNNSEECRRDTALTISKLSKRYVLEQQAVDNLSFSLEYGECFALLGVTGAGKSSTFKCLTGEETPDVGTLFMGRFDLRTRKGFNAARCLIGYCPQFDAIFENLTVY